MRELLRSRLFVSSRFFRILIAELLFNLISVNRIIARAILAGDLFERQLRLLNFLALRCRLKIIAILLVSRNNEILLSAG
jgi:hypothetical protein